MKLYWSLRMKRFCSGSRSVCTSTPRLLAAARTCVAERGFGQALHLDHLERIERQEHVEVDIGDDVLGAATVGCAAK